MERFVCIHGHFYQPPRENPWLAAVEVQDSAYPYHDWNERITAECYAPNADSRILDDAGRIVRIVNNYARVSFNFGPTLLSWLELHAPPTYRAIQQADVESSERFGGHGSAMAQAYSHPILPLTDERDRRTQVLWGVADFEHRFGRFPEGMWLPETAADTASLEALAAAGIRFTVLSPGQARSVRRPGSRKWNDVTEATLDTREPYSVNLPSGRSIAVFFYDGAISRAVAFEKLLSRGDHFARRLLGGFGSDERVQLVHIATDGETYGHHHRFGDMALAWALNHIESEGLARLTNYGQFLELHPPRLEARIVENGSWSCAHGVERWRSDCGCSTGAHPDWKQAWRAPLRQALDWLRDELAPRYAREASAVFGDPWAARDDYIDIVLDRSTEARERFFATHSRAPLDPAQRSRALQLLELQRHALLMYTSCGWFFDEISGIENVQVLRYAGRALQLAEECFGEPFETQFCERLARAPSNLAEHGDARRIYERQVLPARADLAKAGANFAANLLFVGGEDPALSAGFEIELREREEHAAGRARMVAGRLCAASRLTLERAELEFAYVHFGDHNLAGGVRPHGDDGAYGKMTGDLAGAFSRAQLPEVVRLLERHFAGKTYSLETLFRDQQRRIVGRVLDGTVRDAEAVYRRLHEQHLPLLRFLHDLDTPPPRALQAAAEMALDIAARAELRSADFEPRRLQTVLEDARAAGTALDTAGLGYEARATAERLLDRVTAHPEDVEHLDRLAATAALIRAHPFEADLRGLENGYYALLQRVYPGFQGRAGRGDAAARDWVERFAELGRTLRVALPPEG